MHISVCHSSLVRQLSHLRFKYAYTEWGREQEGFISMRNHEECSGEYEEDGIKKRHFVTKLIE